MAAFMIANGTREGKGVCNYSNGNIYNGDWKHDVREGRGVYTWKDGSIYDGEWKNGMCNGYGIKTTMGKTTKGIWKDNKLLKNDNY